jgi:hypothetical protein
LSVGKGSPITVCELVLGEIYTFTVAARNMIGHGSASAGSAALKVAASDDDIAVVKRYITGCLVQEFTAMLSGGRHEVIVGAGRYLRVAKITRRYLDPPCDPVSVCGAYRRMLPEAEVRTFDKLNLVAHRDGDALGLADALLKVLEREEKDSASEVRTMRTAVSAVELESASLLCIELRMLP